VTAELLAPDLASLSDGELLSLYANGTDADRAAVLAECRRQDTRRKARARRSRLTSEWEEGAYAQYLAAEAECCGYLTSREGDAAGISPWPALWTGPERRALRLASEELRNYWLDHPRVTVSQYAAMAADRPADDSTEPVEQEEDMPGYMVRAALRNAGRANQRRAAAPAVPVPGSPAAIRAQWSAKLAGRTPPATPAVRPAGYKPAATVAVREVEPTAITRRQPHRSQGIDGAMLWLLVRRYLAHYISFRTEAELNVVTGWVFHAVARDRDGNGMGQLIWRASPRLLVTSPKRGSGKSTLLDLIGILTGSRRGKIPKITPARIAQVLGKYHETVILDEAKTIFGAGSKSLELQGIMLAGYTRRTSYEVSGQSLSLFGAIAYAAKDELITDTRGEQIGDLLDRSLTVRLYPPVRPMPEVDEVAEENGELLARALVAWTDSKRAELKQASRDLATEDQEAAEAGNLRTAQISRPLRACARLAGPGCEADLDAALGELTEGAAGSGTADLMADLMARAEAWGDGEIDDDAPGRIVTEPGTDDDEEDY
jgi:hypothetical protein